MKIRYTSLLINNYYIILYHTERLILDDSFYKRGVL
jgi:hypothetical protein